MKLILPILAIAMAIYVIYGVWITEGEKRGTFNKLMWTLLALTFSIITGIVYYFKTRK
jgi:hypothetical protein